MPSRTTKADGPNKKSPAIPYLQSISGRWSRICDLWSRICDRWLSKKADGFNDGILILQLRNLRFIYGRVLPLPISLALDCYKLTIKTS
ncbi:hypothetical protein BY996DRAFT_6457786 [Phakopsora pachyrhizi]|nr:hypothetical protein BY996DRAFT_6457786 [Phakopsora pachyrhizi]